MLQTATKSSWPALPDDVWKQVLCLTQSPTTMIAVSQVSKKLLRLSTSEDVYRAYVLQRTGRVQRDAVLSEAAALSWRAVYRNMVALSHSLPTAVRDFCIENARGQLALLVVSQAQNAVFYDHGSDSILGWPTTWSVRRLDLCRTDPATLQSAVTVLSGNEVAIFENSDRTQGKPALVIFNASSGRPSRRLELSHGPSPLSTAWTRDAVHHSPVLLSAGPQGRHVVYLTEDSDLHVMDADKGDICYVWKNLATPFADLVRGPSLINGQNFVVLGVVLRESPESGNRYTVRRITDGEVIGHVCLSQNERLIDVVAHPSDASAELSFIACRVVLRDELVVVVTTLINANGSRTSRREVLSKNSGHAPVRASPELEILDRGRGLLYRPEGSLRFLGPIRVLMRREDAFSWRTTDMGAEATAEAEAETEAETDPGGDTCYVVHSLAYARAGGCAYRWARLSRDGRLLYACAFDNGVISVFDLDAGGRCRGSLRAQSSVTDAFVLWDHVIVGTTDEQENNVCGFHFGRYCLAFPECIMQGEPSMSRHKCSSSVRSSAATTSW